MLRLKLMGVNKKCPRRRSITTWGRRNIKISSYQYRDPHVKDKTVSRVLSLTWESHTWKWRSLHWDGATSVVIVVLCHKMHKLYYTQATCYNDFTWAWWLKKSLTTRMVVQQFVEAMTRKSQSSALLAVLEGNSSWTCGFPLQRAST